MAPPSNAAERSYLTRILASARLFEGAPEEDLGELARTARLVAVPRGKEVAAPKGRDAEIFVVESGALAELAIDGADDGSVLVALYGPGDTAGLIDAAKSPTKAPRRQHKIQLRTLTNATLVALPVPDFTRIRRRSPELSDAYAGALASAFEDLAARMVTALHSPLEQRLAAFFTRLADIAASDTWNPTANIGRLQQTLVADMLGVSREHVNRTLIMWERSGLIFQSKPGDLLIENRKRLAQLAGLARQPATVENVWVAEIEAHLNLGLNEAAHDLAMEGVKRSPRDDRFKYFAALAIARMGALKEALALVEAFKLTPNAANEDVASIGPRLRRDLAFVGGAAPDLDLLRRAAEGYESVFNALGTTYPGVNAAATFAMAGDAKRAKALAALVADRAAATISTIDDDEPSYWARATIAECRLIEGDKAAALADFASAAASLDAAPGKIAATRKQLRRLKKAAGVDDAWIDRATPQGSVLYFSGPLVPAGEDASRPLAKIEATFEKFLKGERIVSAVGALAAGVDIVIAERLLDAGVALHVQLPLPPSDFLDSSVAPAGDAWARRYADCLNRAQTIDWMRRGAPDRATYQLGARIAIGRAVRQADDLATAPIGFFAAQRGRDASNSLSHENADIWDLLGFKAQRFLDDWPATSAAREPQEPAQALRTALIVESARPPAPLNKARFDSRHGDFTIFAFETHEEAIAAARQTPRTRNARLWLDIGVVDERTEPGRKRFADTLVTASCRPQTPHGKVYASEIFVLSAAAASGPKERFEYIGISPTEEKLAPCPLFLADI